VGQQTLHVQGSVLPMNWVTISWIGVVAQWSRVRLLMDHELTSTLQGSLSARRTCLRRICQFEAALVPTGDGHPARGFRDITWRVELEEGVASFDRSRVFVNLEGIKSWVRRALTEDLLRYQSLIDELEASS
jgi:hypothetical protein